MMGRRYKGPRIESGVTERMSGVAERMSGVAGPLLRSMIVIEK